MNTQINLSAFEAQELTFDEMVKINGGDAEDVGRAVGYTVGFIIGFAIGGVMCLSILTAKAVLK